MIDNLPVHQCQSKYCTNSAGYWHGEIVIIGLNQIPIIGWCELCKKYVCSHCALKLEHSFLEYEELVGEVFVEVTSRKHDKLLRRLYCMRCGNPLRRGNSRKVRVFCDDLALRE